ncbi:hypothetical protein PTKIN_Ptkin14bG0045000 [Pterospermum kingtungense]
MGNIPNKRSNPVGTNNRLVTLTDKEKLWQLECADKSIPYSKYKTVWTCNFGWLLISHEQVHTKSCISYQFSLWKPKPESESESLEVINLPPLKLKPKQTIVAGNLLSPPGNPGSIMVILFEENLGYIIYYRFGDRQWSSIWFRKEIADYDEDAIEQCSITYCEGKLYAATVEKGYLMVIEEDSSKNLKLSPLNCELPTTFSPWNYRDKYLLDFRGQLICVEFTWGGVNYEDVLDIDVSRLELSGNGKRWVWVESVEDQAFFISENYAFSCPVNEPEIEEGHIYLFRNKRFYSISIKDKSFSASQPVQNLSESKNKPFLFMRDLIRLCNSTQAKPQHPISKLEEGIVIEDNNEARENNLCHLPYDVLGFIAKKLHPVDYFNFRSLCHNFRLVAPCIKWREASFKLQFPSLCPWLVFSRRNSCATHSFIDPHYSSREYLIKIPEDLLHGKVRYSKDGWLLICSPSFMFFYNPFTKETKEFPQGAGEYNCCLSYGLSSSPALDDSILIGNSYDHIYYFCRREGVWIIYHFPDFIYFKRNHNSPIYFGGAFYFLGRDGKVAVFRMNDDGQVSWTILEELESPCDNFCCNYLLECGGNLLSVFVVDQLVYVYKLNLTAVMTWEKVTSLGNHALFVSPLSSFSVISDSSDMKNKVYFPKLYGMEMVYYCLITDKFYTCGNKEILADFNNTTEFLYSTWIEPRWQ